VPEDSVVVARLRAAGAVVLAKANLSEWANFRGNAPFNGWSARGGFTRDPYVLNFDPCGSSSGSAVAVAANLAAIGVGTETDGSVVCPSGNNMIVGFKPTIGLVSQNGVIPIAHSQDTAGPMTRTVTDNAIMLGVMQTGFAGTAPRDYRPFLRRGALRGKRIGVDRRYFTNEFGGGPAIDAAVEAQLEVFGHLGATLVDTDTGNPNAFGNDEFTVLLFEFKVQIAQYLVTLSHTAMRTLEDLIRFDSTHCDAEMRYFGQQVFEAAQATSGNLHDPEYVHARQRCLALTRAGGIDGAMQRDRLDALVAPSYSFASSPAAVAGYPNISVPVAFTNGGEPVGFWMYASHLQEPKLFGFAFDVEQELQARRQPSFHGFVPPLPPNAGICAAEPSAASTAPIPRPRMPRGL
jgi:amidase